MKKLKLIPREKYVAAAQKRYQDEGTIEIDTNAKISRSDTDGAYVQAWVWVYDSDVEDNGI